MSEGITRILCERGIRTFTDHTPHARFEHCPAVQSEAFAIIVDPSHGTGRGHKVTAVRAGCLGRMGHGRGALRSRPRALGRCQSLYPDQFDELMTQVRQFAPWLGARCRAACASR